MSKTRDRAQRDAVLAALPGTQYDIVEATGLPPWVVLRIIITLQERDVVFNHLGRWFRKKTKGPTPMLMPPVQVDHRAEADAINDRLHNYAPGTSTALRAIDEDPVLSARLHAAIQAGMALPDLSAVPRFRHSEALESAIVEHELLTSGGPCDVCGCTKRRWGRGPFDWTADAKDTPPPFAYRSKEKLTVCAWCDDSISYHGSLEALLQKAFAAAAGLCTANLSHKVKMAKDMPEGQRGDGSPWGHVSQEVCMRIAHRSYHKSKFATTLAAAQNAALPGLEPVQWRVEDLPVAPVTYLRPDRRDRALAAQAQEAERQFQAAKARAEERKQRWLSTLYERDKKREAMTPDEEAEFEAMLARDAEAMARRGGGW